MFQRRQQKITAAFEKQKNRAEVPSDGEEDLEEMIQDNRMLREKLQEVEAYLFHLQRKQLPQPRQFQPRNIAAISDEISSFGGEVVLHSKRAKLRERQDLYLRHFGIQVKYISDELCIVVYNVSLDDSSAEYALQFACMPGLDKWELKKYHLPLGFCMESISQLEPMSMNYMRLLQTALVAHIERQTQLEKFKESKPAHVHIFHSINGTNVEIAFPVVPRDTRSAENIDLMLELKYNPLESRPQSVNINSNVYTDTSEGTINQLMEQFAQIKSHRLWEAFSAAVSRDSSHHYFCPEEEDAYEIQTRRNQVDADRNRQRQPTRNHHQEEASVPPAQHPRKQNHQKQFDELSNSSSDSFSALSQQLLRKKKTTSVKAKAAKPFKKPAAPRAPSPESPHETEDENDEYVTEVLKERNPKNSKKRNEPAVPKATQKKRSHRVSDQLSDVTADSYVYIPEAKSKRISKKTEKARQLLLTGTKSRKNDSLGKENNSLVKAPAKPGRPKK